MLLLVSLFALAVLAYATRAALKDGLISRHGYNNHYSDAVGARDDRLG